MALTHNGTRVDIPSDQLPSGWTKPSPTTFTDHEWSAKNIEFSIAKTVVENATATTTMDNIITQLNTDIDTYISADFDTTGTITSYAIATAIRSNTDGADDERFTTTAEAYVVTCTLYAKTA